MVLRSWNEGWLRRRGKKLGRWKKNYILICGDHLYAFRSVQDRRDLNNPIEIVDLGEVLAERVLELTETRTLSFRIIGKEGSILCELAAESEEQREDWMQALDHCCGNHFRRSSSATMEAYLSKRGHKVKNWKKRYFVLMDGTLLYYRLKIDSSPAGSIPCRGAQLSLVADVQIKRSFCFGVLPLGSSRTYWICASSDAQRQAWIRAILIQSFEPTLTIPSGFMRDRIRDLPAFLKGTENLPLRFGTSLKVQQDNLEVLHHACVLIFDDVVIIAKSDKPLEEMNVNELYCLDAFRLSSVWVEAHASPSTIYSHAVVLGCNASNTSVTFIAQTKEQRSRLALALCELALQAHSERDQRSYGHKHRICRGTMHSAALLGHTDKLQMLINSRNTNCNVRDGVGCCPLHLAVRAGHAEAVEALLNAGADPSLVDCNGDTSLHIAARQGDVKSVRKLCSRMNASNVTMLDADGHSVLWNVLFSDLEDSRSGEDSGRLACVAALLQVPHIDLGSVDKTSGLSLLKQCCERDMCAAASLLLEAGAPLPCSNFKEASCLHICASQAAIDTAAVLLQHGHPPNVRDREGRCPLHLSNSETMDRLLMEHGARAGIRDEHGQSARESSTAGGEEDEEEQRMQSRLGDSEPPVLRRYNREASSHCLLLMVARNRQAFKRFEWATDTLHPLCMGCGRAFVLFIRKHHCRNCGALVCALCSSKSCRNLVDGSAQLERVCDGCFNLLYYQGETRCRQQQKPRTTRIMGCSPGDKDLSESVDGLLQRTHQVTKRAQDMSHEALEFAEAVKRLHQNNSRTTLFRWF